MYYFIFIQWLSGPYCFCFCFCFCLFLFFSLGGGVASKIPLPRVSICTIYQSHSWSDCMNKQHTVPDFMVSFSPRLVKTSSFSSPVVSATSSFDVHCFSPRPQNNFIFFAQLKTPRTPFENVCCPA